MDKQIIRLHQLTGKSMKTCQFCFKYSKGNFSRALKLCSQSVTEDDRRIKDPLVDSFA
jgi:hypothetical protein